MRAGWHYFLPMTLIVATLSGAATSAQQPIGNADVIAMVKSGLPDGTIIRAVQAGRNTFDVSPTGLIALHTAGVNEKIMDAMIAAMNTQGTRRLGSTRSGLSSARGRARTTAVSRRQPSVTMINGDNRTPLPLERTTLASTQAKPSSLAGLAKEKTIDEAMKTGVGTAGRAGGRVARTAAGQAAQGVAKLLDGGKKSVTYVWMLDRNVEPPSFETTSPSFDISLNDTVGVSAADYAPVIVKLTPTPRGALLVGATSGQTSATRDRGIDWPLYSSFVEDRVAIDVRGAAAGTWTVTVTAPLLPGDYAVVMRPTSRNKKYSGVDVARNQGDGVAFNSVWPFAIR